MTKSDIAIDDQRMQKYQSYQNKAYTNSVKKKQVGLLESFYEQGMDDFFSIIPDFISSLGSCLPENRTINLFI